jgi:hypothetical protein
MYRKENRGIWAKYHWGWETGSKEQAGAGLVSWKGQCAGLLAKRYCVGGFLHQSRKWMRSFHVLPFRVLRV